MAEAAREKDLVPVQLSFKGAVQAVNAFAGWLWTAGADELVVVCQRLREIIASYRLEERPTAPSHEHGKGDRRSMPS